MINPVFGEGELTKMLQCNVSRSYGRCTSDFGLFLFRVNRKALVDSIEVQGKLDLEIVKQIKKNILPTNEHLNLPLQRIIGLHTLILILVKKKNVR